MKTSRLIGVLAALTLGLTSVSGQLTSTNIATNATATAIQGDLDLNWLVTSNPSFTAGGLLFEAVANPSLGDFAVGAGTLGTFFADVTFLGRDSLRPNHFGVSSSLGGYGAADSITLFADYTSADLPITRHLAAATYTTADFWHYADKPGYTGSFYQDDAVSFRSWQFIDVVNNLQYTLFGIDDLRSEHIDFNDGAFLVVTNTVGIALQEVTPVPEPGTMGIMGAAALVGVIYLRRRNQTKLSAA